MSETPPPRDLAHRPPKLSPSDERTTAWAGFRSSLWVIGAVLIVAAGCGADDVVTGDELVASGVGVIAEGCSLVAQLGSGVVVERSGQVVTAAHTISGATTITVVDDTGTEHQATVRAFDKDADLAVLDVAGMDAPALQLAAVHVGSGGALTWGRDEGVEYIDVDVTKRLQITIEDIYTEDIVERSGIEVSATIETGDSGGPILDTSGNVIGIIYANSRERGGVAFAVDSSAVATVLSRASATPVDNGRCF